MSQDFSNDPVRSLCRWSLCALAISVSLGVALVSLSKVLLLVAFLALLTQRLISARRLGLNASSPRFAYVGNSESIGHGQVSKEVSDRDSQRVSDRDSDRDHVPRQPDATAGSHFNRIHFESEWVIFAALGWITLSLLWSDAPTAVWSTALMRHSRLLVLPVALYCLNDREDVMAVLRALVLTQLLIVGVSCLLWLGVPLPLHNPVYPMNFGLVINGHLEQPIMSTLMLVVLWHFRRTLFPQVKPFWIYLASSLTVANVLFVMTGRTGFIAMIVAMTMMLAKNSVFKFKYKFAWLIITPVLLSLTLGLVSPRFSARVTDAVHDIQLYAQGNDATSQGYRLDYWHQSIKSIAQAPVLGHGVGSWREEYIRLGGNEPNPPSNPHEQFLLWWVESGLVGFIFMAMIFGSMWRDARLLKEPAQSAMQATWAITLMVSLFNCPFFGAGMGEFFLIIFACLMALGKVEFAATHAQTVAHQALNPIGHQWPASSSELSWIERMGMMVVTQPLSRPVPGNELNYQHSEGLRKLGYRQLRKLVYLQLHSQRHLMRDRADPLWSKGLWIYERTAQIGDSLMDLAPRSLFKEHGLEMDLLTLPHLAPLFEFDPCFGLVLTDAKVAQQKHYDFVIVQSVHHRALIKKIRYFHDLPWICIQGFYDVPDFSRMRWSTQRLIDCFGWQEGAITHTDEAQFEAHARQKLWLPEANTTLLNSSPSRVPPSEEKSHELVLALGGVDPVRTYHRWPELLVLLSELGYRTCLLIGKGEAAERSATDLKGVMQGVVSVDNQVNRTTVMECAQILSNSTLLITADGGMMHLAISSGTRHIISLFTQGIAPEYRLPKDLMGEALQSVSQDLNLITPQEIVKRIQELGLTSRV